MKEMGIHVPSTGLEEFDLIEMLNELASVPKPGQRQRSILPMKVNRQPARWLRRRYQELLAMIPTISVDARPLSDASTKPAKSARKANSPSNPPSNMKLQENDPGDIRTRVSVGRPKLALQSPERFRQITPDEREWIRRATVENLNVSSPKTRKTSKE
jgi:hypothetical protein